jgi:hypothetical protein
MALLLSFNWALIFFTFDSYYLISSLYCSEIVIFSWLSICILWISYSCSLFRSSSSTLCSWSFSLAFSLNSYSIWALYFLIWPSRTNTFTLYVCNVASSSLAVMEFSPPNALKEEDMSFSFLWGYCFQRLHTIIWSDAPLLVSSSNFCIFDGILANPLLDLLKK